MIQKEKPAADLSVLTDETITRQNSENILIDKVRSAVMAELELSAVLHTVVEAISEVFDYQLVSIYLLEGNELIKQHAIGYESAPEVIQLGKGIVGRVAEKGKAELIKDVSLDSDYVKVAAGVISELVVPLFFKGQVEGILNIEGGSETEITNNDMRLMEALADHIVLAIRNSKLFEAEREQRAIAESYAALSTALNRTLQIDDVLELILSNLNRVVPSEAANMMLIDDGIGRVAKSRGYEKFGKSAIQAVNSTEINIFELSNIQEMIKSGEPHIIPDVSEYTEWKDLVNGTWIRSHMSAPINVAGETIGFIHLDDPKPNIFNQDHANKVMEFSDQVSYAIQNARLFEQIEQSERRYRAVVEDQTEMISRYLPDGTLTFVNEAFCKLHGQPVEELIGQKWQTLVQKEDSKELTKEINLLSPSNPVYSADRKIKDWKGEDRWINWTNRAFFDDKGVVVEYQGIGRDISESKAAEEALEKSEQFLKKSQEIGNIGSWMLDLETNVLTWSDEVYRIFGLTPQQFGATYEAFLEAIHPEDRERVNEGFSNAIANNEAYEIVHRVLRPDGEVRIVREKSEEEKDSEGKAIFSIGMVHDITERVQNEEALARQKKELEERNADIEQHLTALESKNKQLSTLQDTGLLLTSKLDLDGVLDGIGQQALEVLDAKAVLIAIVDEDEQVLRGRAMAGGGLLKKLEKILGMDGRNLTLSMERSDVLPLMEVIRSGEPQVILDIKKVNEGKSAKILMAGLEKVFNIRKLYNVPLQQKDQATGVLSLGYPLETEITPEMKSLVLTFASQAAIAVENARLYKLAQIEIHEREMAEDALQQSEELVRTTIMSLDDLVFTLDLNGIFLEYYQPNKSVLYAPPEVFLGQPYQKVMPAHIVELVDPVLQKLSGSDSGDSMMIEYQLEIEKTERWFNATISKRQDSSGGLVGFTTVVRDITDRKYSEVALAESEERYRTLFEAPYEAIAMAKDGKILEVNAAFSKMFGYSNEDASGMLVSEIVPEHARDFVGQQIREQNEGPFESTGLRAGGDEFPVEVRAKQIQYQGKQVRVTALRDLTERKQAEQDLLESESRYRDLFENANDLIQSVAPDGSFQFVNEQWLKTMEYSREEVNSLTFMETIHPDHLVACQNVFQLLHKGENVDNFDTIFMSKTGKKIYVEGNMSVSMANGEMRATRGIFRDITEKLAAERELAQTHLMQEALLEGIPDGVFRIQHDGVILDFIASHDFETTTSPDEFLGKKLIDGLPKNVGEESMRLIQEAIKTEKLVVHEYSLPVNEEERFYEARMIPYADDQVLSIVREVSDRVKAQQALAASEEKFRELADLLPQTVWELDSKGYFTYVNREGFRTYGYAQADLENGVQSLDCFAPEDRDRARQNSKRILQGEDIGMVEYSTLRKDGTILPIIMYANAIVIDGEATGLRGIIIDITDRKRHEQELIDLNASLEQRVDDRTEELQQSLAQTELTLQGAVLSIARIVEMRDPYTAGHQGRVAKLSQAIALEMKLPDERIRAIHDAALIHDVGKINIPTEILSKPGKLTNAEYEIIKEHVQIGRDVVSTIDFRLPVEEFIAQHHERLDGSGYPAGISGDEIHLESRILGVSDVVEAMTADRPYRNGLDISIALGEIKDNVGILFDEEVVKACVKLFEKKNFEF